MSRPQKMDRSSRLKDLFFKNLLLLGFDVAKVEKKYRVPCDKNMFTVPNQKMFEVVTHFLFSKLEGKYVLPWPLMGKDQSRQFQKLTLQYLTTIAKESNVKFPRMSASSFSTFSGDRFYEIYVAFSAHVVEQEIISNDNVELLLPPKVSSQNYKDVAETLKIETVLSVERFKSLQKISLQYFEDLLKCANDFSLLVKKLQTNIIINTKKLCERNAHLCSLYCESSTTGEKPSLKESIKKSLLLKEKVKKQWATLENFLKKDKELWKCLRSEIEEKGERFFLDSKLIKVPDNIAKNSNEVNAVEVNSAASEDHGKPCLIRYMKLFVVFLESLLKSYSKGNVSYLLNHCKVENTCDIDESLDEMKLVNKNLEEVVTNVKESTEKLQEMVLAEEFSEDLEGFIRECHTWNSSSKSFMEKVKHIRATEPKFVSDENAGSSFLLSNSSTETPCCSKDLSFNTELLEASGYSDNFSGECSTSTYFDPSIEETLLQTTKVDSYTTDAHFNTNMLSEEFQSTYLKETNSNSANSVPKLFFDLDFDISKPIKMRESWQLEDSLQAMTLPDDSICD